jgi:glycosyltransferase involved in cell wall biosynthesis
MAPEVTVLLPVFNGEHYLRETMQSILEQTYRDFEFLIVDDGSTDGSPGIIRGFADPRIRVLLNPKRLKLSGALNRGIEEATGRYIARMDADDIALPDRLRIQVDYLEAHPGVGLCGTAIEIFGKSRPRKDIFPLATEDIRSYALFDCPFCHPSVMLRKELLEKHDLRYDGSYYPTEDYELWSRAIELFPTANLEDVLLRYRIHEKSMTGADWDEMDRQAARVIEPLLQRLQIDFSEEDLQLHRNIGRGRSCRLKSLAEVERAEHWLIRLIDLNRMQGQYDDQSLARVIGLVWYRLCMNSSHLGLGLFKRYRSSILAGQESNYERLLTLLGSVVKNRFYSPPPGEAALG